MARRLLTPRRRRAENASLHELKLAARFGDGAWNKAFNASRRRRKSTPPQAEQA